MKHRLHRAEGYLKAEIIGEAPEKFIRICMREHVKIWHIVRKNETTLICFIKLADSNTLKKWLKASDCRIRILRKAGLPFFMKKMRLRLGITVGFLFFILLLLILSNMVWSIRVDGADVKLEEQIRSILKQNHLYEGSLDLFIPDTGRLESALSTKLTKVTWIGVSKEGTTYKISVVQKKYPKPKSVTGPRNLVATKQAVVQRLFIETGQPVVESDQFVKKGQVLVSGRIGNEKASRFVSAKGKVVGETWYHSEAQIPLVSQYTLYSGNTYFKYKLKMWHVQMPLWGFKSEPYKQYDREIIRKPIRFLIWKTPFAFIQENYRQKKTVVRKLTQKQAIKDAIESSDKKLLDSLPKGSKIVSSTVDYKKVVNNSLYIRTHQVVNENIAVPKAIDVKKEKKKLKQETD
ncbi:sporulation protein YqfD [Sporolactobacillus shoreicorticis]|uniref:Sporulation protein YqfD n=1 Tax=Sporolactobacillus shoreicorticis TaxID=1923877 RepID=A0ABW5S5Q4_9BACL|nr:sporulation protein YqfD [Sporolactobacillus shoreicorticis]MCO7126334.1 sporulation protein YqfD [Sporolactobacillus shoreicorticis]